MEVKSGTNVSIEELLESYKFLPHLDRIEFNSMVDNFEMSFEEQGVKNKSVEELFENYKLLTPFERTEFSSMVDDFEMSLKRKKESWN